MSLFSKIFGGIAKVASFIPGPIGIMGRLATVATTVAGTAQTIRSAGQAIRGVSAAAAPMRAGLPALGTRVLPGVGALARRAGGSLVRAARSPTGQSVMKWTRRAAEAAGYIVVGKQIFDSNHQPVGRISGRRKNPMNVHALRRAISRVKSAKNICSQVEKLGRKIAPHHRAPAARRGRCAPEHCH